MKYVGTMAHFFIFSVLMLFGACVPSVNQPLILGSATDETELKPFLGHWKLDSNGDLLTILVRPEKNALRFSVVRKEKESTAFVVSVRKLSATAYIFNLPSDKLFSNDRFEPLPTLANERRYFVGVASFQGSKLVINGISEQVMLADIRSGAYAADVWNMCLKRKMTPQTAVLPPPTIWEPCIHLMPTREQLNDYIARRGRAVFSTEENITLTR
jgi:hypothetical protein